MIPEKYSAFVESTPIKMKQEGEQQTHFVIISAKTTNGHGYGELLIESQEAPGTSAQVVEEHLKRTVTKILNKIETHPILSAFPIEERFQKFFAGETDAHRTVFTHIAKRVEENPDGRAIKLFKQQLDPPKESV